VRGETARSDSQIHKASCQDARMMAVVTQLAAAVLPTFAARQRPERTNSRLSGAGRSWRSLDASPRQDSVNSGKEDHERSPKARVPAKASRLTMFCRVPSCQSSQGNFSIWKESQRRPIARSLPRSPPAKWSSPGDGTVMDCYRRVGSQRLSPRGSSRET
jgi:hypothetical protein